MDLDKLFDSVGIMVGDLGDELISYSKELRDLESADQEDVMKFIRDASRIATLSRTLADRLDEEVETLIYGK